MRSGDDNAAPYHRAALLVQLELLRMAGAEVKPELLLHRAGLDLREIAMLLEKKYDAVAKAVTRARHGRRRPTDEGGES